MSSIDTQVHMPESDWEVLIPGNHPLPVLHAHMGWARHGLALFTDEERGIIRHVQAAYRGQSAGLLEHYRCSLNFLVQVGISPAETTGRWTNAVGIWSIKFRDIGYYLNRRAPSEADYGVAERIIALCDYRLSSFPYVIEHFRDRARSERGCRSAAAVTSRANILIANEHWRYQESRIRSASDLERAIHAIEDGMRAAAGRPTGVPAGAYDQEESRR